MPVTRWSREAVPRNSPILLDLGLLLAWTAWAGAVSLIDVRHGRVSNRWFLLVLPLVLLTVLYRYPTLRVAMLFGALGLLLALILNLPAWTQGWMGGADVKAYAVIGLGFGPVHFVEIFLAASLLFGVAALLVRMRGAGGPDRLVMLPAVGLGLVIWLWSGPWWLGESVL